MFLSFYQSKFSLIFCYTRIYVYIFLIVSQSKISVMHKIIYICLSNFLNFIFLLGIPVRKSDIHLQMYIFYILTFISIFFFLCIVYCTSISVRKSVMHLQMYIFSILTFIAIFFLSVYQSMNQLCISEHRYTVINL